MGDLQLYLNALGAFVLVALAARFIGKFFSSYGLPYITGYLLTGALAGPFVFEMMKDGDAERLRFVDELSLAVIAFIAGSELYLKELQSRLRPIMLNILGLILIAPPLLGIAIYIATDYISFTSDFSTETRIAVSLLGATILLALSPASTIAVIQEVRARGDFTRTVLSITVVMDVIIVVLFAVSVAIASALIEGTSFGIAFLFAIVIDLVIAVIGGVLVGKIFEFLLASHLQKWIKTVAILAIGLIVFVVSFEVTKYTKEMGFEIHLEPLLIAMISGFYVTNFTEFRRGFDEILHDVSPAIYVAFFTLTGVALKLDVLLATGLIAGLLFGVRIISIILGSYVGSTLANENNIFKKTAWMGLITQAGIALGLSREVAVEFPALGDSFATLVISVVVLNEIFGPMFLKLALRRTGEAHEPTEGTSAIDRDVLIMGIEPQSIALARQLKSQNWQVKLADINLERVYTLEAEDVEEHYLETISDEALGKLMNEKTDAVVLMLDDDADNLKIATYAYENCGVKRIIVRVQDISHTEAFRALNAAIVNPTEAMVNLLDQYVRAPQSTMLMMHTDPNYDIVQITVTNRDIAGLEIRDLRLPSDVLILEITRNGNALVPNGHTPIQYADELTLVGSPQNLAEMTLRFGF